MTQQNIVNDLSSYTRVPAKILKELLLKSELCIGSAIHDALLAKEDVVVLDIGIGTLSIELATMQCKYVPSKNLKNVIKKCINEKVDPIEQQVEEDLTAKLIALCEGAE